MKKYDFDFDIDIDIDIDFDIVQNNEKVNHSCKVALKILSARFVKVWLT